MKLSQQNNPLPYILIDDFYTEQELKEIWKELEFINTPEKLSLADNVTSANSNTKGVKAVNRRAFIHDIYRNPKFSNIYTITHVNLASKYEEIFKTHKNWFFNTFTCKYVAQLLSYYENADYYLSHQDDCYITMLTWLFKEPKVFEGGELTFTKEKETIELKSNRSIIFPSQVYHEVSPLVLPTECINKRMGRYCITTFLDSVPPHQIDGWQP